MIEKVDLAERCGYQYDTSLNKAFNILIEKGLKDEMQYNSGLKQNVSKFQKVASDLSKDMFQKGLCFIVGKSKDGIGSGFKDEALGVISRDNSGELSFHLEVFDKSTPNEEKAGSFEIGFENGKASSADRYDTGFDNQFGMTELKAANEIAGYLLSQGVKSYNFGLSTEYNGGIQGLEKDNPEISKIAKFCKELSKEIPAAKVQLKFIEKPRTSVAVKRNMAIIFCGFGQKTQCYPSQALVMYGRISEDGTLNKIKYGFYGHEKKYDRKEDFDDEAKRLALPILKKAQSELEVRNPEIELHEEQAFKRIADFMVDFLTDKDIIEVSELIRDTDIWEKNKGKRGEIIKAAISKYKDVCSELEEDFYKLRTYNMVQDMNSFLNAPSDSEAATSLAGIVFALRRNEFAIKDIAKPEDGLVTVYIRNINGNLSIKAINNKYTAEGNRRHNRNDTFLSVWINNEKDVETYIRTPAVSNFLKELLNAAREKDLLYTKSTDKPKPKKPASKKDNISLD